MAEEGVSDASPSTLGACMVALHGAVEDAEGVEDEDAEDDESRDMVDDHQQHSVASVPMCVYQDCMAVVDTQAEAPHQEAQQAQQAQ
jgi:hypothetical protein